MITAAFARRFALSLPGAEESPHFHLTSFRVAGKIFMTIPPEEDHLRIFLSGDDREASLAAHPDCVEKLWWGTKVCGVKLNIQTATRSIATQLIESAWKSKAPRGIATAPSGSVDADPMAADADFASRARLLKTSLLVAFAPAIAGFTLGAFRPLDRRIQARPAPLQVR